MVKDFMLGDTADQAFKPFYCDVSMEIVRGHEKGESGYFRVMFAIKILP
jgi:hypothetical protein